MSDVTCKKCGAKVSDEFSYCFNCGNRLDANIGRKTLSETRQGAVAGGLVGFLYGIFTAVQSYFTIFPEFVTSLSQRLASDPRLAYNLQSALSISNTVMYVVLVMVVPFSALLGCVLGVLFVKLRKHIPGSSIIRKSVVFALMLTAISFVPKLPSFLDPRMRAMLTELVWIRVIELYAWALVVPLVLGWLFGYLLERRLKSRGINQESAQD